MLCVKGWFGVPLKRYVLQIKVCLRRGDGTIASLTIVTKYVQ